MTPRGGDAAASAGDAWDSVLDVFSARLSEQRAALVAGRADDVPPFAPPPGIGAVPDRLRRRAEALLQEATELQAELEAMMAATSREVQVVRRVVASAASAPPAHFVDRRL